MTNSFMKLKVALESSHAIFGAMELAKTMTPDQDIVICLSGRGDKGNYPLFSILTTYQMFRVLRKNFLGSGQKLAGISDFKVCDYVRRPVDS